MAVDMVIKNGTVVVPNSSLRAHVIIDEGKVKELTPFDDLPKARETIDATGLHVLPGLIDPHVHFRVPGLDYKEDFTTGSQAAVAGGITTIIDMPNVTPMTKDIEGFNAKMECAVGKSHCDFGVYAVIVADSKKHILALADAGVLGYKIFLGSTVGGIEAPSDVKFDIFWATSDNARLYRDNRHAKEVLGYAPQDGAR